MKRICLLLVICCSVGLGVQNVQAAIGETITVAAPMNSTNSIMGTKFADNANSAYYFAPAASSSLFVAGQVGIGTTAPEYKLDIKPGTTGTGINVYGGLVFTADGYSSAYLTQDTSLLENYLLLSGRFTIPLYVQFNEQGTAPSYYTGSLIQYYFHGAMWAKDDLSGPHNLFTDELVWHFVEGIGSTGGITTTASSTIYWQTFRNAVGDYIEYSIGSPKGWDGLTAYCDIYWMVNATGGNVKWELIMKGLKDNSLDYQGGWTATTVTPTVANYYMAKSTISFTWPSGYDMVWMAFTRKGADAADTSTASVYGQGVRCRIWN